MGFRNEDGSYNVIDRTEDGKNFEVWEQYFENVDISKAVSAELCTEAGNEKLKITNDNNEEVWYSNVHGSWGFPTVVK